MTIMPTRRGILDTIGGALKTAGSNYMAMPRDQRFLMGAGMFTDGVGGMAQGYAAGAEMADMAAQRKRRGILDTRADAEWEAKQRQAEAERAAQEAFIQSLPEAQRVAARVAPDVAAKQALTPQDPVRPIPAAPGTDIFDPVTKKVIYRNPRAPSAMAYPSTLPPGFVPEQ